MKLSLCVALFYILQSSLVQSTITISGKYSGDINYFDFVKKQFSHLASSTDPGVFLTPLIRSGHYKQAQHISMVVPDIMGVRSYSGFLTVNTHRHNHLFFWFFPAQNSSWSDLPLVLWLQGGPGISSMYGLFEELGPFKVEGMAMKKREFSWNNNANLLIIDQPVGTGFSFSETSFFHDNGTAAGEELYNAVVQFHQLFPNFQRNKFYITGESYAGHYIPVLGHIIHENNPTASVKINLAGMMLGNPWSDPVIQNNYGEYLYNIGMSDYSQEQSLKALYEEFVKYAKDEDWSNASIIHTQISAALRLGTISIYDFLKFKSDINLSRYVPILEGIRELLHVGRYEFHDSNYIVFNKLSIDTVYSVKPLIEELLEHYPMVFYSGQLDIICAYPMTATLLRSLNWTGHDLFQDAQRTKWCIRGNQVGFVKRAGNLYEVLIRDAGHMVPADQPEVAFNLLQSVITAPRSGNMLHGLHHCWPLV